MEMIVKRDTMKLEDQKMENTKSQRLLLIKVGTKKKKAFYYIVIWNIRVNGERYKKGLMNLASKNYKRNWVK